MYILRLGNLGTHHELILGEGPGKRKHGGEEGKVRGTGREGVSGGENEEDETVGGRIFIGSIFIGIFMVCRVYTPHEPQTTESCVQKLKSSVTLCLECHMEREGEKRVKIIDSVTINFGTTKLSVKVGNGDRRCGTSQLRHGPQYHPRVFRQ
jgi:hypothetical protein